MPRGGFHHSRRAGTVYQATFSLDKLFQESAQKNSKGPSAARSAGTVGKWGITSFTTNSLHNNNAIAVKTEQSAKPKKFFKSRNADPPTSTTTTSPPPLKTTSPTHLESDDTDEQHKPPIVLRIFKGTSCIVADGASEKSPPPQPATKRGRRRSSAHTTPPAPSDTPPRSPRPKRTRREVHDPAIQSIISQLVSEDEDEGSGCESYQPSSGKAATENPSAVEIPAALSENKENVVDVDIKQGTDVMTKDETDADEPLVDHVITPAGAIVPPSSLVTPPCTESCDENDSQTSDTALHTPSTESPSGLKLVIKKSSDLEAPSEPPLPPQSQPVKKKSIFKSRVGKETNRRALYKHNYGDIGDKRSNSGVVGGGNVSDDKGSTNVFDVEREFSDAGLMRMVNAVENADSLVRPNSPADDLAGGKVKCVKSDKGYYTVVRNVKRAHQIQESGEFQEFNDDVDYILDALKDNNPIGTRCLSAITLAGKCMVPAFRMHLRAHGTVDKFFKALHDATHDPSLGLCTATVMFVLSQDRLNMDLDRDSLELMLNLLECDASHKNALDQCGMSSAQLHKNKQKVKELCGEIQSRGLAKHLDLDNITVGQLAMETLLSLTSKRAGEWFKEELRELGGLEHIVRTISECSRSMLETYISQWTDPLLDRLRKIDRCLRVLENVTSGNEENQVYLLKYQEGVLLATIIKLYKICNDEIALYPCTDPSDKISTGYVLREALLATLKVLINLTQEYNTKLFCETLLKGTLQLVQSSLHLLLQVPNYIPDDDKFDFIVMVLTLLINLVENNDSNRIIIMDSPAPHDPESVLDTRESVSAISALVKLFYAHEKSAYDEEVQTDAILDGKKDDGGENGKEDVAPAPPKSKGEEIEETIAKLLKKAGNHMEHTFICAYIALLLGYIIMDDKQRETAIRSHLHQCSFRQFIAVLDKFYNFMKITACAVGSNKGNKATEKILNYFIAVEKPPKVEPKDEPTDLSISALYDSSVLNSSSSLENTLT